MKRSFIGLLLICLTIGEEITVIEDNINSAPEFFEKEEEKDTNEIIIAEIIITAAITATVSFICTKIYDKIYYHLTNKNFVDTYKDNGNGRWLSNIKDGYVTSCYFHKTRKHSATCDGGFMGSNQKRCVAEKGKWACAMCKAGVSGRKTYYNDL